MPKQQSRNARWAQAAMDAREAFDKLSSAFSDLTEVQSEYESWQENLPENLAGSATNDKLSAIVDLDLDILSDVESAIDEADGMELPLGFGRD